MIDGADHRPPADAIAVILRTVAARLAGEPAPMLPAGVQVFALAGVPTRRTDRSGTADQKSP